MDLRSAAHKLQLPPLPTEDMGFAVLGAEVEAEQVSPHNGRNYNMPIQCSR